MKKIIFKNSFFTIAVLIIIFSFTQNAGASSGDNVTGYAWTSNVGWISFNCTNTDSCFGGGFDAGGVTGPDDLPPPAGDETGVGDVVTIELKNNLAFSQSPGLSLLNRMKKILNEAFTEGIFNLQKVYADETGVEDFGTGTSYGVSVDPATGILSGYAWNSEIGWISFKSEDVSGCPSVSCTPKINFGTNKLIGWAKALGGGDGGSGWDGWISLSCNNTAVWCGTFGFSPEYKATYDTVSGNINNFTFGSKVVGWVKFSGATYAVNVDLTQPIVTLGTADANFCPGDTQLLTWNATGPDGMLCSGYSTNGDPAFSGPIALSSPEGGLVVTPTAPSTTYTITCTAPGGDAAYQDSVTFVLNTMCIEDSSELLLSASPTPVTAATGYTTTLTWYSPTLTNFSSCIGTAYNVSLGVPPMTLAVPPTGFEGVHTPPMAPLYTQSDAGVYVSNTTNKFVIDCVRADTGAHVIAETLVTRAILYPTCAFNNGGTFLSGSPTKATLSWTSTDALTASATSTPGVGVTWTGTQLLSGIKSNVNFVGSSTTYFLNVGAGAETSQCKAVLDIPVLCDTVTEICDCDPEVPGGSCYEDPNCEDPNGCEPDKIGALTLTATPNTFTLDEGETATTALTWDGNGVDGTGVTWSSPATSFGPVNCAIDGTDSVTISSSTVFTLTCNDIFGGPDIPATTSITVNGIDPPCDFIPDNGIEDCDPPITGFTRPVFIER